MRRSSGAVLIVFFLAVLTALGACRTPAGRTAGDVVDDSVISSKVKTKLLADDFLKGVAVEVNTFEQQVTLTGAVQNEEQKRRAEELAKDVAGVRKVNNLIMVRGAQEQPQQEKK